MLMHEYRTVIDKDTLMGNRLDMDEGSMLMHEYRTVIDKDAIVVNMDGYA